MNAMVKIYMREMAAICTDAMVTIYTDEMVTIYTYGMVEHKRKKQTPRYDLTSSDRTWPNSSVANLPSELLALVVGVCGQYV